MVGEKGRGHTEIAEFCVRNERERASGETLLQFFLCAKFPIGTKGLRGKVWREEETEIRNGNSFQWTRHHEGPSGKMLTMESDRESVVFLEFFDDTIADMFGACEEENRGIRIRETAMLNFQRGVGERRKMEHESFFVRRLDMFWLSHDIFCNDALCIGENGIGEAIGCSEYLLRRGGKIQEEFWVAGDMGEDGLVVVSRNDEIGDNGLPEANLRDEERGAILELINEHPDDGRNETLCVPIDDEAGEISVTGLAAPSFIGIDEEGVVLLEFPQAPCGFLGGSAFSPLSFIRIEACIAEKFCSPLCVGEILCTRGIIEVDARGGLEELRRETVRSFHCFLCPYDEEWEFSIRDAITLKVQESKIHCVLGAEPFTAF